MAKKRVHELAKLYDLPSKEVLKRLTDAGIEVKAAASAVDENIAEAAINFMKGEQVVVLPASMPERDQEKAA